MEERHSNIQYLVRRRIGQFRKSDEDYIRASLAKLRRGLGKNPGEQYEIFEFTLKDLPITNCLPRKLPPERFELSREAWASHITMTLFALHQQGQNLHDMSMSNSRWPLGRAVGGLTNKRGDSTAKRRFDALMTSEFPEEMAYHLRGIVQLLKDERIPLDYPQLAEDLLEFQTEELRDAVRLQWGIDYYSYYQNNERT